MNKSTRVELAAALGRDIDPLAEYEDAFASEPWASEDPFEMYHDDVVAPKNPAPRTIKNQDKAFRHWREHMAEEGRHYALPSGSTLRGLSKRRSKRGTPRRRSKRSLVSSIRRFATGKRISYSPTRRTTIRSNPHSRSSLSRTDRIKSHRRYRSIASARLSPASSTCGTAP